MNAGLLAVGLLVAQVMPPPVNAPKAGQATVEGQLTAALVVDVLPRRNATEFRPRVGLEITGTPTRQVTFTLDTRAEGLAADRDGVVHAAHGEVRDAWVEARWRAVDVRAGYGRLAWGRLDEIAPTDVISPIDASRFLFEGRAEARLPTSFVRGRLTPSERLRLEAVVVPVFRRGTFDRLDEATSPFNLTNDVAGAVPGFAGTRRAEPTAAWRNVSGGGRIDVTLGRVDVGISTFRGFDGIGPVTLAVAPGGELALVAPVLVLHHPRFTMVGGDFGTVTGEWAWRGEIAAFVDRALAASSGLGLVDGRSIDAGVGADRRAGEFRVFGSAILHREWSTVDGAITRTDVSVVGSIERTFGREHYLGRAFAVVNPADRAAFLRAVLAWKPRDRVSIEGSAGAFLGSSDDTIGRFKTRDFILVTFRTWIG